MPRFGGTPGFLERIEAGFCDAKWSDGARWAGHHGSTPSKRAKPKDCSISISIAGSVSGSRSFFAQLRLDADDGHVARRRFGVPRTSVLLSRSRLNMIGIALHICANLLDNADGQLARLLNQKNRRGRIIDSLVDHVIFLNIYVHLALRCWTSGASPAVIPLR